MDNLLELVSLNLPTLDGEPFTTSTMIADHAEVKHHANQQLIRKYTHDLQEFGKVAFEMQPMPSRQRTKIYLLNEQQATLIITYLESTALVREFKKAMARQFYAMRKDPLSTGRRTRSRSPRADRSPVPLQSGSMPIPGAIGTSVTCYARRLPA
jgi:phage regulator Rha-like protein